MKNNLHISILLLVSLIMILPACEKEVPLDVEKTDQKLAILCTFSPGEPFNVELAKSISLFHSNPNDDLVDDAEITICSDTYCAPAFPLPTNDFSNPNSKYQSSDDLIIPEENKDYNICVKIDGFDPISAQSVIPQLSEISHSTVGEITKYSSEFDSIQDYNIRLAFKFSDDQDEDNYYHAKFYQVLDNVSSANLADPDTIALLEANQGFSLIDDKLSGGFTVTSGGVLFKDVTFNKSLQELVFEPNFSFDNTKHEPVEIIIELRTVSKEYYDYYSSAYRQNSQANVPFSDPTIVFSNVTNGLGVFAGYNKDRVNSDIEF